MSYTGRGAAKINLAIDVLKKRPDGYHDVAMIMQSVSLYDNITIKANKYDISLTTNSSAIPVDESNIVYKAAVYLKTKFSVRGGAHIHIEKNIPVAAGLAGGSTDAAAALKLLNKAWDLRLTKSEMMDIGKKLGADVPFCIQGGTALAEGLGEKLSPAPVMPECHILLAKPSVGISTKEVYQNLKLDEVKQRPNINELLSAMQNNDLKSISNNLCNVLETVSIPMCPIIAELKQKLLDLGALGSLMSGSGPTVFGIFEDKTAAYNAYDSIKHTVNEIFVVKTSDGGEE